MLAELLQPSHVIVLAMVLLFFFGGRWFARLGTGFKDAVRNFRIARTSSKVK